MLVQRGVTLPSNVGGIVYLEFPIDHVEVTFDTLRQEFENSGLLEYAGRGAPADPR